MKKILSLLLLPVSFALYSCNNNEPKELVVNKWKIINIDMPDMPLHDSIKASAMRGTIELTKDGKWIVTGMGRDQTGSYTLSENGKTIFIITNGRTETNQIMELSKTKMVLFDSINNSKLTIVPR
jgi:hypothetical protein